MFSELLRDWRKGAGHKYMRRVPYMDKRGRKRYRYTYQAQRGGGVTQAESMIAGSAFKLTHKGKKGHFHIESVDGGKLKLKHDESGQELELSKGEFQRLLQLEHGEALGQAAERAEATARQAKKTGSAKQIKRAEAEAKRMRKIAEQGKEQEAKEPEPAPEPALPRIEGSLLEESFKPTVSKEQARFYNRAKMFERSQADLQRDLDQTINRIDQEGLAAIKAGADEARVRDEVQASAQRASDLYMKMIARSGDFANPFATGRGGFNFKRNDKKRALYDKASGEFLGAVDEAKNKIRALVRSSRVIRSGQSDTVQKLRDRIAELESARTKIKEDNKAARKVKGETTPTYSLSNLGAEIRRLKERLKAEERKPKTGALKQEAAELEDLEVKIRDQTLSPQTRRRALDSVRDQRLEVATKLGELRAKEESGESGAGTPSTLYKLPSGGRVEIRQDQEDNRIRLFFPNKPNEEQRQRLKKQGFRWSPRAGAWQRQLTDNAVIASGSVLRSMGAELVQEDKEPVTGPSEHGRETALDL